MIVISLRGKAKIVLAVVALALFAVLLVNFFPFQIGKNFIASVMGENDLKPIYSVDTDEKKVALSLDACWGAEKTEKILDILDKYKVKTTFFW
ncbi:MAG TPA: hypothetical protein DEA47_05205 [Peptococcaceae bacterium]|nr:MAG: Polysaccharide deacetylase [Clostridia bacterium 41_269]HBT20741.1 hypothetical protein [Peptococcaceae bacterium]